MIDEKTQSCISCIHCRCSCRWYCNDHAEELYENELLDENDCADYQKWEGNNDAVTDTIAVVTSDEEHTYNVGFLGIEEKEI